MDMSKHTEKEMSVPYHLRVNVMLDKEVIEFLDRNSETFENKSQLVRSALKSFIINKNPALDHYITNILRKSGGRYNKRIDVIIDALMRLDKSFDRRPN